MEHTKRLLSFFALASILNCSLFAEDTAAVPADAESPEVVETSVVEQAIPDAVPVETVEMTEPELMHFIGFLAAQSAGVSTLNLDTAAAESIATGMTKTLEEVLTLENVEEEAAQSAFSEAEAREAAIKANAEEIPEISEDALEKIGFIIVMEAGLTQLGFGAKDAATIRAGFLEGMATGVVDPATYKNKMPAFQDFMQNRVEVYQARIFQEKQAKEAATRAEFAAIKQEWSSKEPMTVVLETTQGLVEIKLLPEYAPLAVANFVGHIENGYYDGLIFHRVIKDFMVQGGDPFGTGAGGESIWGKPFPDEFTQDIRFDKVGQLAMANSGPMTNGSQFFITTSTPNWLNDKHTIFGEVTVGYDLVEKISLLETGAQNRPLEDQKIIKAYVKTEE